MGNGNSGGGKMYCVIWSLRGNTMTDNRTVSLREENLPSKRFPRGPPKTSISMVVMKTKSRTRPLRDFRRSPRSLVRRRFYSRRLSLSFFSLVFSFPWCFSCCGIPWSFWVFSAYFPGFLRVRKVIKILGVFEVFLGIFETRPRKRRRGLGPVAPHHVSP